MTKNDLCEGFGRGKTLSEMLEFIPEKFEIFKAKEFIPGNDIIYIPDLWMLKISVTEKVLDPIVRQEVLSNCYTGDDFIAVCEGDEEEARRIFAFCDWRDPVAEEKFGPRWVAVKSFLKEISVPVVQAAIAHTEWEKEISVERAAELIALYKAYDNPGCYANIDPYRDREFELFHLFLMYYDAEKASLEW